MAMLVKHLVGWISDTAMCHPDWLDEWMKTAVIAAKEDCELVVFKIPKLENGLSDGEIIARIEKVIKGERGFW